MKKKEIEGKKNNGTTCDCHELSGSKTDRQTDRRAEREEKESDREGGIERGTERGALRQLAGQTDNVKKFAYGTNCCCCCWNVQHTHTHTHTTVSDIHTPIHSHSRSWA